ncbi:hypothetical protein ACPD1E_003569, partial [Vibrio cholerae]
FHNYLLSVDKKSSKCSILSDAFITQIYRGYTFAFILWFCSSFKPTRPPAKALIDGRYRDNFNGTITDTKTNLIWMRCSFGPQWTGSTCVGLSMETDWNDALKTAVSFFSYAGHSTARYFATFTR